MVHLRRAYLEALRAQLQTLTGFGGVYIKRVTAMRMAFPVITLYADAETVDTLTIHPPPRPQERVLTVAVNVFIRGAIDDEKAEADADALALLIEQKLRKPAGADDLILVATDFVVAEDEPEVHVLTLTFKIEYQTVEFSPSV